MEHSLDESLLNREIQLPRLIFSPLVHALGLITVGNFWIVAVLLLWKDPKSMGAHSLALWTFYFGAPIPLMFWAYRCIRYFGPHFREMNLLVRLVFVGGLISTTYPAILFVAVLLLSH